MEKILHMVDLEAMDQEMDTVGTQLVVVDIQVEVLQDQVIGKQFKVVAAVLILKETIPDFLSKNW